MAESEVKAQVSSYLTTLEGRITALQAQLEIATASEAAATVRAATAEARADEFELKEEAADKKAQQSYSDCAMATAKAQAAEGALATERMARLEAEKRCTKMLEEMGRVEKREPIEVKFPPLQQAPQSKGWNVKIQRDGADNMIGFSLTPKE